MPFPGTSRATALPSRIVSGSLSSGLGQSTYSSQCAVGVMHIRCALNSEHK